MKKAKKKARSWQLPEVQKIVPLVRSIMLTVRETYIACRVAKLAVQRYQEPPRPNRQQMIAKQMLLAQEAQAESELDSALDELHKLDVMCLDAVQGYAVFPFVHKKKESGVRFYAWFVYSLHDEQIAWQYQEDDHEIRRSLTDL